MIRARGIVGAALSMLLPTTADPPPDPPAVPAGQVTADVVANYGLGCMTWHFRVDVNSSNERLQVTHAWYLAAVGPHTLFPATFRARCQLHLNVNAPPGYTYAVSRADYPGWAWLAEGATGHQRASFHFEGDPPPVPVTYTFTGPMDDNWRKSETVPPEALAWAPCDAARTLVLKTELRVFAGTSDPSTDNILAMDYIDAPPVTYHLSWRRC